MSEFLHSILYSPESGYASMLPVLPGGGGFRLGGLATPKAAEFLRGVVHFATTFPVFFRP